MKSTLHDGLYTILSIAVCLLLGKVFYAFFPALPASLFGMVIYCFLLQRGVISAHKVASTNLWFIKNMGVCFVPAGVGIINHFDLLKEHGVALVAIIFISTFVLLTSVGAMAHRLFTSSKNGLT